MSDAGQPPVVELEEYRRRRDPSRTPEPAGGGGDPGEHPVFVVQRHEARRLHYDLRLEMGGVLASWAVPRGIPLRPGERRMAVHVEDHPLEYASFEGTIPAGNYGAGRVEIWDRGTYELVERKRDGGLTVRLNGRRLTGVWTLVPAALDGDERNWLLIRKSPAPGEAAAPRRRYRPMLAGTAEALPRSGEWLYEVKLDGYRALARLDGGEAGVWSRNLNDLGERFPSVRRALPHALATADCVVDGEICALDAEGRPRFSALRRGAAPVYYLFDLLELDGRNICDAPLEERRRLLADLFVPGAAGDVRFSQSFEDGEALLQATREHGLEGVMAKRLGSPYRPGRRSDDWRKVKNRLVEEFLIAGFTRGTGSRERLGALVLAEQTRDGLAWVGNCGSGLSEGEIARLLRDLAPLVRDTSPLTAGPSLPARQARTVTWVEPRVRCLVEFAERTPAGVLRAPVYRGRPEQPRRRLPRPGREVRLTNLDKPYWPQDGITKGDLIDYYREVAPVLVPHLRDRPFTMKRYPDGIAGEHFFQKQAPRHMPSWIPRFQGMPIVNDEPSLLWMVNLGCIDMNAWYSRVDRPDRPDFVLFDLDPPPEQGFAAAVEAALLVRDALQALDLESWPKTSGADGIHVLVPVQRRYGFDDTRRFAEAVAGVLARLHPGRVTTEWSKARRRGVLIDANQNGQGKTIASAYSVRPLPGAPVSTPLRWDEVGEGLDPGTFTMATVLERVGRHGDLFEPVLTRRQRLRHM
ncbi:MAG: DNA ligase D [Gaiellales bacterium]